jgi:cellulose synthase/poly-beta-1,6-N-acetylglucosamine synthase-like glycosyltransferase
MQTGEGAMTEYRSVKPVPAFARNGSLMPRQSRFSSQYNTQFQFSSIPSYKNRNSTITKQQLPPIPDVGPVVETVEVAVEPGILRTIMMVTCYSEGEAGIRSTLDSLARTDYPDSHKMLFIVADGIITGSGNKKSTPEILIDMIQLDPQFPKVPEAYSYVAIADGTKRHNMARVYAGRYLVDGHNVPTILVVKCGTPAEQDAPKPGNRGKRDSQIVCEDLRIFNTY